MVVINRNNNSEMNEIDYSDFVSDSKSHVVNRDGFKA